MLTEARPPKPSVLTSISPTLGAAIVEAERIAGRSWQPDAGEHAEALAELRAAIDADDTVALVRAALRVERMLSAEWTDGTPEQLACRQRLQYAVSRRR